MKRFLLFSILTICGSYAFSQRLLTEDFNYVPGQLTNAFSGANVSGGVWVTNTGTGNPIQVVAGSLSYPNYTTGASSTNNNKLALNAATTSAEDAFRDFTGAAVTSGTVYMSFLMNIRDLTNMYDNTSATGDFFTGLLTNTSTSAYNTGRIYAKKGATANTFVLGVAISTPTTGTASGAVTFASTELAVGVTHLVTLAYVYNTGAGNDEARLFINKAYAASEPAPDAVSTIVSTGTEAANVGRIFVRQGTGGAAGPTTPNVDLDGYKVSTSYTDAAVSAPVPLSLISFKANLSARNVQLAWTSANEFNVKSYSVERSADGINFTSIGSVDARNLNQAEYTFTDASALQGINYYRLRMTDRDGDYRISNVVVINNRKSVSAQIFPNPASDNLTVTHETAAAGAMIRIFNTTGQEVKVVAVQEGTIQSSFLINDLMRGNYVLSFENKNESAVTKFIKN